MKPLSNPGDRWYPKDCKEEDLEELQGETISLYRAAAARGNYLSQDRSDIRYAVKELCRNMSKHSNTDRISSSLNTYRRLTDPRGSVDTCTKETTTSHCHSPPHPSPHHTSPIQPSHHLPTPHHTTQHNTTPHHTTPLRTTPHHYAPHH